LNVLAQTLEVFTTIFVDGGSILIIAEETKTTSMVKKESTIYC
jgi:hypothetical protein